jgi:trans-aconitate methyltransferase
MPVAAFLAERGAHVTGVDTSAAFIELCRKRLPAQEFLHADMRGLRLGRQFDGVLAWDGFFHLTPEDQRGMFDVFARHTAPQGVLMFNTGGAFGEVVGSYRGDSLYHASLDEAEYRTLLAQSGFNMTAHAVDDTRQGGGRTIWLARKQPEQLPG